MRACEWESGREEGEGEKERVGPMTRIVFSLLLPAFLPLLPSFPLLPAELSN